MEKVIVAFSGGLDSTVLLGHLIEKSKEEEIHCCIFKYGSTHNQYEVSAAFKVIEFYQNFLDTCKNKNKKLITHLIDISDTMKAFSSSLLLSSSSGGEIPEGKYDEENMKKTVVPARNLIFSSIMAGLAESIGARRICLAIHQGDHYIYPDCREEFAKALDLTVYLATNKKVELYCPFVTYTKVDIIKYGSFVLKIPIPYYLTRSCYKNQFLSCGKCPTCRERLEAFAELGLRDCIEYEKEEIKEDVEN